MLMKQQFKTLGGAQRRAAFEVAHCNGRFFYNVVRCVKGEPDPSAAINVTRFIKYSWRLDRILRDTGIRKHVRKITGG